MDGEAASISIVNDSPPLKLRADICKEGAMTMEQQKRRRRGRRGNLIHH